MGWDGGGGGVYWGWVGWGRVGWGLMGWGWIVCAGVTGIVGDPHVDIKEGICKEHVLVKDLHELFTRVKYGITTNPKIEYLLLVGFMVPGRE